MLFDSHTHYFDEMYGDVSSAESLLEEIIKTVPHIVICGTNPDSCRRSLQLAEKFDGVYAACGLHPEDISDDPSENDRMINDIKAMLDHPKCVALGEIGLDYYWRNDNREEQKRVFDAQLSIACGMQLPVVVHDREAHGDSLAVVKSHAGSKGVFHSFSGSRETASELVSLGWYISFTGVVTFKNATRIADVVRSVPDDRLMIETDCPYLSPVPHRGERNDSRNLRFIAEKIAELRDTGYDYIADLTEKNALDFFNIR